MDEDELQQSIRTLEVYRAQLESFDRQAEFLSMTIKEHDSAMETLKSYKECPKGTETLIPIGAGSFIFASVGDPDRAMVGIGADVVIDTNIDDAIEKLDQRIKEIEDASKTLSVKYQEVAGKASELTEKVQSAYGKK